MKGTLLLVYCLFLQGNLTPQVMYRSGIFLHHSTGQYIWGPNPDGNSTTTIPVQMSLYNVLHGYSGNNSVSMEEEWWSPYDNEWITQHLFFEGDTSLTNIMYYLENYRILVIKSCFPSSAIEAWGEPADTNYPDYKTVYNYKWHWRHILMVMRSHPENFFVIWTNAPLEYYSTNLSEAMLSKKFCRWAKDTLAGGLDPFFGAFPPNVYVFDYFSKLTGHDGIELAQYAFGPYDSHPNGAATDFIAPQFVNEIFNASIAYETNPVLHLQNISLGTGVSRCYNAMQSIYAAGSGTIFSVGYGGSATLIAGHNINFLPGSTISSGGHLNAHITTSGQYCPNTNPSAWKTTTDVYPMSTGSSLIQLFPNPVNDILYIRPIKPFISDSLYISLFNAYGNRILQKEMPGGRTIELSFSGILPGFYVIRISGKDVNLTKTVIKY